MPDPFDSLRSPVVPIDPEPAFAARLRARVARALSLPEGVIVSETTLESTVASRHEPGRPPTGPRRPDETAHDRSGIGSPTAVVPYVIVSDARRALDWYVATFGARRAGEPMVMADGRIGHAELRFGASAVFLADSGTTSDVAAPDPAQPATVSLLVEVADVDQAVRVALGDGASLERAAADNPYGRNAVIRDPFGHRWIVSAAPTPPPAGMRQGDIAFASLNVPDVVRAARFFEHVLGWRYAPGSASQGRQVVGTTPHHGLWGDQPRSTLFLCYMVDDVDDAVVRVRDLGGEAAAPTDQPYGRVADCVDDQGTPFAVFHPPAGAPPGGEPTPNGLRHGDLAYVTLETPDAGRARAFYGALLGWRFAPGRVEEGWQVDGVRPMTGLHGGHGEATGVPFYRVDDVRAAVQRVQEAGGTAGALEVHPYGTSALCQDDQGTRFSLGEM
jgi:predicted enzyme related to lactoylglutathione lyase